MDRSCACCCAPFCCALGCALPPLSQQNNAPLVEELLGQLAVFRQPRMGAPGSYCLK